MTLQHNTLMHVINYLQEVHTNFIYTAELDV